MTYIDQSFYSESFGGREIPQNEFDRLADIASDIIYDVCNRKPDSNIEANSVFKKAVCYETELLYEQGGVDAILGFSEAALNGNSESLGDYSISAGTTAQAAVMTYNGIPISPLAVMSLKRLGLMTKWVYAEAFERRCKYGKPQNVD